MKIGRNEFCPCGSGKKYKACCLNTKPLPAVYIPKNPSVEEVNLALEGYEETAFCVTNGVIEGTTKDGLRFQFKDYTEKSSISVMPEFASRPECLSCFFTMPEGDMFYQTKMYVRIYNDDMSLKKYYTTRVKEA